MYHFGKLPNYALHKLALFTLLIKIIKWATFTEYIYLSIEIKIDVSHFYRSNAFKSAELFSNPSLAKVFIRLTQYL